MTAARESEGAVARSGTTSSAAAPRVAFPVELLAAAKGIGIMTDYFRPGKGKKKRGKATRSGDGRFGVMAVRDERRGHGRGWGFVQPTVAARDEAEGSHN